MLSSNSQTLAPHNGCQEGVSKGGLDRFVKPTQSSITLTVNTLGENNKNQQLSRGSKCKPAKMFKNEGPMNPDFGEITQQLCTLINDNLEAMAKQLYDYWFVQFDFPNEDGKPYKSSGGAMVWNDKLKREIPKGWYADNICKIANILSGGTPSKAVDDYWNNGTIPFFGPTECNGSVFQIKTADHITQKGLDHCASSLFEEGIVIITARGSIGKLVIVGTPMAMNQSCYALQSKEGEYEYLYFLTTQLIDCLKAKGSGSVFKSIIASDIEHSTLCVATENVVSDFCKKVKPLFEKLKTNTIEIAELTKQRDELLPLLMNGQATVNYHLSDD